MLDLAGNYMHTPAVDVCSYNWKFIFPSAWITLCTGQVGHICSRKTTIKGWSFKAENVQGACRCQAARGEKWKSHKVTKTKFQCSLFVRHITASGCSGGTTSWPPVNSMWAHRAATTVPLLSDSVSLQKNKEAGSPSCCQSSPLLEDDEQAPVAWHGLENTAQCLHVKINKSSRVKCIYKALLTKGIFATCCTKNWRHKCRKRRGIKINTLHILT